MKTQIDGLWQENRWLKCINLQNLQFCNLILAGIAAVALHAQFHLPLRIPGHHGIEWMGILIFARCLSPLPGAASLVALSAAASSLIPVWGFHENGAVLGYLLSGILVDFAYRYAWVRNHLAALAILGALAYVSKPLLQWGLALGFGVKYNSLSHGIANVLANHFMFGVIGALTGGLAARVTRKVYQR